MSFNGSSAVSVSSSDPPSTPMGNHGNHSLLDPAAQERLRRRAHWVADTHSSQCLLCADNFSLVRRRHHCRACGTLVCNDCSKYTSRVVPGFESELVRICQPCFIHNYAILLVWHSWFSYSVKLISGEEKATAAYAKLSSDASRIMVRMHDGCVLQSWFKNDQWQSCIVNRVQAHRRELMAQPQRSSVPPPSDYVAPPQDSVFIPRTPLLAPTTTTTTGYPSTTPDSQIPGSAFQAYNNNNGNGIPPPMFTPSQRSEASAAGGGAPQPNVPPSISRTHQTNSTFLNCFIAYRNKTRLDPLLYSWIDVRSEPDMPEMLQTVKGIVERAGVVQAALVFGVDRRVHFVHDNEGTHADFAAEAETACLDATVVVAWQVMDGSQMTRIIKWSEVPLVVARLDNRLPSVVLSMHGNVLGYRNCSVSTLDVISRTAGAAIVSGNVVVVAIAVMNEPASVRLFDSALLAHKEIRDNESGLLFACMKSAEAGPDEAYTVTLLAAHPSIDPTLAMVQFQPAISDMLDATKNGVSGTETRQSPAASAGGRNSATKNGIPVNGPFSQNDADEEARRELLSCPICIELYTVDVRKPCICGGCGNSICHGCISSLRHCPYCRHEFTAAQKSITNIALLALVEASGGNQVGGAPQNLGASTSSTSPSSPS